MADPRFLSFSRLRLGTRQLMLLIHLDEQRSILRAGEATHMTQPAASKLLAALEESLGVRLFDRNKRGVEPTWYGEVMVRYAREALRALGQATEEIAALKSGLAGQAFVGTVVNPGTNLVPLAIAELKRKHPRILVRIEMDSSKVLLERLATGHLDMAIARIGEPGIAGDLSFEALATESHVIVGRAGHALTKRRRVGLKDLEHRSWILPPPESILRQRLNALFASKGLRTPSDVVEATSLPVITSLLQKTDMITVLQEDIVFPYCKAGMLAVLPVTLKVSMQPFGIVTRGDGALSPGARAMLAALRASASRMYRREADDSIDATSLDAAALPRRHR